MTPGLFAILAVFVVLVWYAWQQRKRAREREADFKRSITLDPEIKRAWLES